jgi:Na+/phosphate symporter
MPQRGPATGTAVPAAVLLASRRRAALLALASPLLILLALVGLLHRTGSARWEALPALLIGAGLLFTSITRRRTRRRQMLRSLRHQRVIATPTP